MDRGVLRGPAVRAANSSVNTSVKTGVSGRRERMAGVVLHMPVVWGIPSPFAP